MTRRLLLEGLLNTAAPPVDNYMVFSSTNSFSISRGGGASNDGTIEYSTDGTNWNTWDYSSINSVFNSDKYYIYFRGINNTYTRGYYSGGTGPFFSLIGTDIACGGRLESLLDYRIVAMGGHPWMSSSSCRNMFINCTSLISAPALHATQASYSCYRDMFNGCTSLTVAPELPATYTSNYSYYRMFKGCTSLVTIGAIAMTNVYSYGCYQMFYGCTSLVNGAITLQPLSLQSASYCYAGMFQGCSSLASAPTINATTLGTYCYMDMFNGCSSLSTPPALIATTLAASCYRGMFNRSGIITPPTLAATTLTNYCYAWMFNYCTRLASIPAFPATTLAESCYYRIFEGCTLIKVSETQRDEYQTAYSIPSSGSIGSTPTNALTEMFLKTGGTFKDTPTINTTYYTSNTIVS